MHKKNGSKRVEEDDRTTKMGLFESTLNNIDVIRVAIVRMTQKGMFSQTLTHRDWDMYRIMKLCGLLGHEFKTMIVTW